MKPILTLRFALASLLLVNTTAQAIVIRHDRDEALCRCRTEGYPMVCRVAEGMGTLIDSLWVITAAHVAEALPREGAVVRFGDRTVDVSQVVLHPDYAVAGRHRDLALLRLGQPVTGITPARLYERADELGSRVVLSLFVMESICPDGSACTQARSLEDLMRRAGADR